MAEEFHSGKRLKLARELKGWTQETLIDEPQFPTDSVKTLYRWEKGGISLRQIEKIEAVANIFGLETWTFIDPRLTKQQFLDLVYDPSLQEKVKEKLISAEKDQQIASLEDQVRFLKSQIAYNLSSTSDQITQLLNLLHESQTTIQTLAVIIAKLGIEPKSSQTNTKEPIILNEEEQKKLREIFKSLFQIPEA